MMRRRCAVGLFLIVLLAGCDNGEAGAPAPSHSPEFAGAPSPSSSLTVEAFRKEWCQASTPILQAFTSNSGTVPGDGEAMSDLLLARRSLNRLVSDLQDAGLLQEAGEVRELSTHVQDWAIASEFDAATDDLLATQKQITRAHGRVRSFFYGPSSSETFGFCIEI